MGNCVRVGLGVLGLLLVACSSSDAGKANGSTAGTGNSSDAGSAGASDGGASDGGSSGSRMADPERVRAELRPAIDAQCTWLFKCCSAGELAQELGPATETDCADHLFQSATVSFPYGLTSNPDTVALLSALDYLQYGFADSRLKVDTKAISACAAKIAKGDCNAAQPKDHCEPVPPAPADDPCRIEKLLLGTVPLGGDCTPYQQNECGPGLFCRSVGSSHGVCLARPAVGDLCLTDQDCGALICAWASGQCEAGAAYGEKCAFTNPDHPVLGAESIRCQSGLLCDALTLKCSDPSCAAGVPCQTERNCPAGVSCVMNSCGSLKKDGETCYQTKDCEVGTCTYDPLARRSLCSAPKGVGATCQQPSDCASGFCQYDSAIMGNACAATKKDGATCNGQGEACTSGKCALNVCKAVKAGETCNADVDCAPSHGLFCSGAACALAPFADGKACSTDVQCASQACIDLKCTAKGSPGDACGAVTDAPCDDDSFCDVPAKKSTGKCAAKKTQGELCTRDVECVARCQATRGELRCQGVLPGVAQCGGT